jgi:quinoprotein relay system zinc metallohydrolase 2
MPKLIPYLMVVLLAGLCLNAVAAANFMAEIAPGVYLHRGQLADVDSANRGDSANLGVVLGTRCVAVIDSGGAVVTGQALHAAIRAISDKPVCYVINTHGHFDHVLGNAAFVAPGTEFIGHENLSQTLADNRDYFATGFAAELGGPGHAERVVAPTRTIAREERLDLGGRTLLLRAEPLAHSNSDLTVLDEQSQTLFAGDLLFRERLPVLEGSLKGWLAWLAVNTSVHYGRVVPGHGPLDEQWPAGARAAQSYLNALLSGTRAALARGMLLEDAQNAVAAAELPHWQLTTRAHRLNVSRAFRELEWE